MSQSSENGVDLNLKMFSWNMNICFGHYILNSFRNFLAQIFFNDKHGTNCVLDNRYLCLQIITDGTLTYLAAKIIGSLEMKIFLIKKLLAHFVKSTFFNLTLAIWYVKAQHVRDIENKSSKWMQTLNLILSWVFNTKYFLKFDINSP